MVDVSLLRFQLGLTKGGELLMNKKIVDPTERQAVASNLDKIADAVSGAPEIDREKVEAVKDALSRGVYEVDPDRIARKLLNLDAALNGSGTRRR